MSEDREKADGERRQLPAEAAAAVVAREGVGRRGVRVAEDDAGVERGLKEGPGRRRREE